MSDANLRCCQHVRKKIKEIIQKRFLSQNFCNLSGEHMKGSGDKKSYRNLEN